MKPSFSSVLVLAALPYLVLGAPWRNRHVFYARSVEGNATATAALEVLPETTLAKAEETTAFVNSTTIAEETATATETKAESTASATIIKGESPLQTALLPSITDWNSCQGFLSKSGINLFVNQINLDVDVVINQVNVFKIFIDDRGRARETRVRHAFPQPTNYYPEYDRRKNGLGNKKGGKGKSGFAKPTITAIATAVTETAGHAEETANAEESATETATNAEETATATAADGAEETATETAENVEETATETAENVEETATETAENVEETATATGSASTTAAAAEETKTASEETAAAEATALY